MPSAPAALESVFALLKQEVEEGRITPEQHNALLVAAVRANLPAAPTPTPAQATADDAQVVNAEILRFFREQKEDATEPWRAQRRWAQVHRRQIVGSASDPDACRDALRRKFVTDADSGRLAPLEVLMAQYTLFSEDTERGLLHLQGLLAHVAPEERVRLHNWTIFDLFSNADKMRWGNVIDSMTVPLFPVWPYPGFERLESLNSLLLNEEEEATRATAKVSGGGAFPARGGRAQPHLREHSRRLFRRRDDEILGRGAQHPLPHVEGGGRPDMVAIAEVEALMRRLKQAAADLPVETQPDWRAMMAEAMRCLGSVRAGTDISSVVPSSSNMRRHHAVADPTPGPVPAPQNNNSSQVARPRPKK